MSPKSSTHVGGESDGRVVPMKGSNKDGQPSAESLEGRRPTKENIEQPTPPRTQSRPGESRGLLGVREVARKANRAQFTALLHHVTVTRLQASFSALKRDAAPGVDGLTWHEYETDLEAKLTSLHGRLHQGTYRAQPSKRAFIPKADGRQRPLPAPAFCTLIRTCGLTPSIQGGSRMQQFCPYGSVRGAAGDCRPYRVESPAAFGRRCIPADGVAPPSNIPDILGRRALSAGRLAALGATPDFHHGLLASAGLPAAPEPIFVESAAATEIGRAHV